jgi:N-acetylmuramoyl-L-alanine amidase
MFAVMRHHHHPATRLAVLAMVAGTACARAPVPVTIPPPGPSPVVTPAEPANPPVAQAPPSAAQETAALPPIPFVDGPLNVRVTYPSADQLVTVRDSNFIYGSVGSGNVTLTINGEAVPVLPNGAFLGWLPVPTTAKPAYELVATKGADRVAVNHPIRFPAPRPPAPRVDEPHRASAAVDTVPRFVRLRAGAASATNDTDAVVIARPQPTGTYKWFLLPGTVVQLLGHSGASIHVRLDSHLDVWVDGDQVETLDKDSLLSRRTALNARVSTGERWTDLRIPVGSRPAFNVEERRGEPALVLTLYGTVSNTDIINFPTNDPTVRDVTWEQVNSDRARYTVYLRHAPYGYLVLWERGAIVLRVRRAPVVNRDRPLAGLVIAVDPGHPPIGSTGPTGLYEGDAVLAVAELVKPLLEARGATVVMTRATAGPVGLAERPVAARRANADALVSIHLNALADGTNPFRAVTGTGTYFFHDHAEPLARAVQRALVHRLGLRDAGINYDNLAVARLTWAPAILCEGAFIIIPEQEAALRNPEFQQRYAMGIVEGLEEYFRQLALPGGE